jgi:hypothetical protein
MLVQEQKEAILLREKGYSYREILQKIPVAKSTLSLWLRKVGLSKRQKQKLTLKRIEAGRRGAQAQKNKRYLATSEIKEQAKKEIAGINIGENELWLMGAMLYWAEGSKEKEDSRTAGVKFSNSDPLMLHFFVKWLTVVCKIPRNNIIYELYLHDNNRSRLNEVKSYWESNLGLDRGILDRVYFKKHKINTQRKNVGDSYFGLIRIRVLKSAALHRKIAGWIEGVSNSCCRVV